MVSDKELNRYIGNWVLYSFWVIVLFFGFGTNLVIAFIMPIVVMNTIHSSIKYYRNSCIKAK